MNEYGASELLNDSDVMIGDTITFHSPNQEGYKKWKVIEKKCKGLALIRDYDNINGPDYPINGGRRKSNKRRAHRKRRTRRRSRK
jgi:hypothetical protein